MIQTQDFGGSSPYDDFIARVKSWNLTKGKGIAILVGLSAILAIAIAKGGLIAGILALGAIVGIPVVLFVVFNLKFGVLVLFVLSFFILGIKRILEDLPLGTAIDGLTVLMAFGLFLAHIKHKDWRWVQNPISLAVGVWIFYSLLEVANPIAASRLAWVYTVRSLAGLMIMYYIVLYTLDDIKFATLIFKLWIVLALLGALYCLFQEFAGLLPFEQAWLKADERRYELYFQAGKIRKWSFFSDPMIFGFIAAYTCIFCFVLAFGPYERWKRLALAFTSAVSVFAMVFSGTRAAFILIPAGVFFYAVLTLQRQILMAAAVFAVLGAAIIFMPTGNPTIVRLQSAFKPNDDPSYKLRKQNQAFIQPFIQKNAMGGGLGSVGVWGEKFSPNSPLAKFPPDSGFVRVAVEMGWLGLLIYCSLFATIMWVGIRNHFQLQHPKIQNLSTASLCFMFILIISNFPQEAVGQIPTSLFFYILTACINRLPYFDKQLLAI